jgi:glycosyltransferase involved in cell wall biosynthesis
MESATELPLSVLIRTLNEADRIGKTIASVASLGAEVVVIDAGSKDTTVAIAEGLGATVFTNPWPGFGPQRRFGEDKCTRRFVFSLDADEIITAELAVEIRAALSVSDPARLFIVRKAWIHPHHTTPGHWPFCHEQVLIYDRSVARTGPNPNWDKLEIDIADKPVLLKNPLWHFSLRDWHHAVAKFNYTSKLAADTQKSRSRLGLILRLPFEFPINFLKAYFVRRYFLAGADGFIMATIFGFGRFLRIAMMLERRDYRDPS